MRNFTVFWKDEAEEEEEEVQQRSFGAKKGRFVVPKATREDLEVCIVIRFLQGDSDCLSWVILIQNVEKFIRIIRVIRVIRGS